MAEPNRTTAVVEGSRILAAGQPGLAAASRTARYPADRRSPRRRPPIVRAVSWSMGSLFFLGISWGESGDGAHTSPSRGRLRVSAGRPKGRGSSRKSDAATGQGWVRSSGARTAHHASGPGGLSADEAAAP